MTTDMPDEIPINSDTITKITGNEAPTAANASLLI